MKYIGGWWMSSYLMYNGGKRWLIYCEKCIVKSYCIVKVEQQGKQMKTCSRECKYGIAILLLHCLSDQLEAMLWPHLRHLPYAHTALHTVSSSGYRSPWNSLWWGLPTSKIPMVWYFWRPVKPWRCRRNDSTPHIVSTSSACTAIFRALHCLHLSAVHCLQLRVALSSAYSYLRISRLTSRRRTSAVDSSCDRLWFVSSLLFITLILTNIVVLWEAALFLSVLVLDSCRPLKFAARPLSVP